MRVEFRLSGSGGQGLLLAGIVLAEARSRTARCSADTELRPRSRGVSSKAEV
jgi:2-oxoglutarate ferredoxin oxidoreductase subunit gamma